MQLSKFLVVWKIPLDLRTIVSLYGYISLIPLWAIKIEDPSFSARMITYTYIKKVPCLHTARK